jgi:RNA polymerase sigma factor (sigma-70 family)
MGGTSREMAETPNNNREGAGHSGQGVKVNVRAIAAWFIREVLPLEPLLTQFLQSNWRNRSDVVDLRQEVYSRIWLSAGKQIPDDPQRFILTTARNLLITRLRDEQIVPIEAIAELDVLDAAMDTPGPDRIVIARDELRRLQSALDDLPPRCREAVVLAHIEELNGHQIAQRMNISESTVSMHLKKGLRALTDAMYGGDSNRGRKP